MPIDFTRSISSSTVSAHDMVGGAVVFLAERTLSGMHDSKIHKRDSLTSVNVTGSFFAISIVTVFWVRVDLQDRRATLLKASGNIVYVSADRFPFRAALQQFVPVLDL